MLFIYLCTTFIKRIIHKLICSERLYMKVNVQCTLYKIVLQMYVLFVKLLVTVESKFNTNTGCRLNTIDNYHSRHSHSIHSFSGCILTWARNLLFCVVNRYNSIGYHLFNHSFNLNVTLLTIILQYNFF